MLRADQRVGTPQSVPAKKFALCLPIEADTLDDPTGTTFTLQRS
jgi:hypothetical protein